jgi:hypothetical protein
MASRWLRVFSAAWWALVGWSARFPVGYGLSGSVAGGPEPWVRVRGGVQRPVPAVALPLAASVAPPPLLSSIEPPPSASAESREHSQRPNGSSPPATRKRVVLLPHAQIESPDTRPTATAPEGPQA